MSNFNDQDPLNWGSEQLEKLRREELWGSPLPEDPALWTPEQRAIVEAHRKQTASTLENLGRATGAVAQEQELRNKFTLEGAPKFSPIQRVENDPGLDFSAPDAVMPIMGGIASDIVSDMEVRGDIPYGSGDQPELGPDGFPVRRQGLPPGQGLGGVPGAPGGAGGPGGRGGVGGGYGISMFQSKLAPGGYYPPGFLDDLGRKLESGEITTQEYQKEVKAYKKWRESPIGAMTQAQRAGSDLAQTKLEMDANDIATMSEANVRMGEAQLQASDAIANNQTLLNEDIRAAQSRMQKIQEQMAQERDRLLRETRGAGPIGEVARTIMGAIGVGLGAYAATLAGTRNFAQDALNSMLDNELQKKQVEIQKSQKIQNSLGQEMSAVQAESGMNRLRYLTQKAAILDGLKTEVESMKMTALGDAGRARVARMEEVINKTAEMNEFNIEAMNRSIFEKQMAMFQAARAASAAALARQGQNNASGMVWIEGNPKDQVRVSFRGPDGRPRYGFTDATTKSTFETQMQAVRQGQEATRAMLQMYEKNSLNLGPLSVNPMLPGSADARRWMELDRIAATGKYAATGRSVARLSDVDEEKIADLQTGQDWWNVRDKLEQQLVDLQASEARLEENLQRSVLPAVEAPRTDEKGRTKMGYYVAPPNQTKLQGVQEQARHFSNDVPRR